MHIETHSDRIWNNNLYLKEEQIKQTLDDAGVQHQLVDAVLDHDIDDVPWNLATDNYFLDQSIDHVSLLPEFWHIYRVTSKPVQATPDKLFNCMVNRISGERLHALFLLHRYGILDKGYVNFNCLNFDKDPDLTTRQNHFKNLVHELEWQEVYADEYNSLLDKMPLLIPEDPDVSAMKSQITFVIETYCGKAVAFSEKIFRALQTPRPWVLLGSPFSVCLLRDYGFDVLDDCVDHSYDSVTHTNRNQEVLEYIIDMIKKEAFVFDEERCKQAVQTNQKLLAEFETRWPQTLSNAIQYIGSNSHLGEN
jgi:hypothetical protein